VQSEEATNEEKFGKNPTINYKAFLQQFAKYKMEKFGKNVDQIMSPLDIAGTGTIHKYLLEQMKPTKNVTRKVWLHFLMCLPSHEDTDFVKVSLKTFKNSIVKVIQDKIFEDHITKGYDSKFEHYLLFYDAYTSSQLTSETP
jgi:hypothetical protein